MELSDMKIYIFLASTFYTTSTIAGQIGVLDDIDWASLKSTISSEAPSITTQISPSMDDNTFYENNDVGSQPTLEANSLISDGNYHNETTISANFNKRLNSALVASSEKELSRIRSLVLDILASNRLTYDEKSFFLNVKNKVNRAINLEK
jgi:hypothetical protein